MVEKKAPARPQDRKPKKADVLHAEVDGIKVSVPVDAIDDFDLLVDLSEMQTGNPVRIVSAFRRLLGDDYERVMKELKGDSPRLTVTKASEFFHKTFKALDPNS